jgi:hypothetical protein
MMAGPIAVHVSTSPCYPIRLSARFDETGSGL